jgi:hypothetical protein
MTLNERIEEIKSLQNDQNWYIVKQNLNFKDLCYATKILEDYKNNDNKLNYEDYFALESSNYGIANPTHRMTVNCYYLGLLKKHSSQYRDSEPTEIYYEIKKRCSGDFSKKELYEDLMINQIEKVYTSNLIDEQHNSLRKDFKIHPTFFLYKILIILGDLIDDYSINLSEFKLFLGTAKRYDYFYSTIALILESRHDSSISDDLTDVANYFDNNRFNTLFSNLPYINNGHNISLKSEYIDIIRKKIFEYESKLSETLFSVDFLSSTNKITSLQEIPKPIDDSDYNVIYFGPPGTGKSYKVDKITTGYINEKVTFHPEYDYNSFVGGYKPITDDNGDIKYKFVPQIFTNIYVKAWKNKNKIHFLQIEEINRGNVAAIFGDLFQLLDRNEKGYSRFDVSAEEELKKYLEKEFEDVDLAGIKNGKLCLPNNLRIIATMNTSDQSLFPIDSAFKRRWKWKFVPIDYKFPYSDFTVILNNGKKYKWLEFIKSVNEKIYEITKSPDKQIGNFFINASFSNNKINEETILNKVFFYLWNDIFKDENETIFIDSEGSIFCFEKFFEFNKNDRSDLISYILEEVLEIKILQNDIETDE